MTIYSGLGLIAVGIAAIVAGAYLMIPRVSQEALAEAVPAKLAESFKDL